MSLYIPQTQSPGFFHSPLLAALTKQVVRAKNNIAMRMAGGAAAEGTAPTVEQQMLRRISGLKTPSADALAVENRLRAQAEALRAEFSPATPADFRTSYTRMEPALGITTPRGWLEQAFTLPTSNGPVIIAPYHGRFGPIAAVHEGFEAAAGKAKPNLTSPIYFGRRLIGQHVDPKLVLGREQELMATIPQSVINEDSGLKFIHDFRKKYNEYAAINASPYYIGPAGSAYYQTGKAPIDMQIGAAIGNMYGKFIPKSLTSRLMSGLSNKIGDYLTGEAVPQGIPWGYGKL